MTTTEIQIPETVMTKLQPFWRFWNLGHYAYFKKERELGKAKLQPFVIDQDKEELEKLKAALDLDRAGRYVPQGEYVKLYKMQKDAFEIRDGLRWQVVMSDTPDEFNDHADVILNAHGRVLIHGLGLGCVLNCVRMRPDITHIDVVEVDEDVLNLIQPFYDSDDRIEFHLGSCVDIKWPRGTHWNYVWHDIWTTISPDNLTDDHDAEHGISYARLHRMFASRSDAQGSWAFDKARQWRQVFLIQHTMAERFAYVWSEATPEERFEMLVGVTCPAETPLKFWKAVMANERTRKTVGFDCFMERCHGQEMEPNEAFVVLEQHTRRIAMQKLGMI